MSDQEVRKFFQDTFNALLERDHVHQKEIAEYCGVSTSTVSTWSKGLNVPRMDKLDALASYFNVSRSYFIERSVPVKSPDDELIAFYGECKPYLDQDDIEDIALFMRMKAERKKQKGER